MAMTVKRRKDKFYPSVFVHKVADIRGGVSVKGSELSGPILREGTPLSKPVDGICHVVKIAVIAAAVAADALSVKVLKGHHFKSGDILMAQEGGSAVAIKSIDSTDPDFDVFEIGGALGELAQGSPLMAAAEESESAAFKFEPFALAGTGKPVVPGDNIDVDAWVIGVTKGNELPAAVAGKLKGIVNY